MLSKELIETLKTSCTFYINELKKCKKGSILLRGTHLKIVGFQTFTHNLANRKPLHTPIDFHDILNEKFENIFGWKVRNGVFCYGYNLCNEALPDNLGYGPFFICFPQNNFDFVYSPTIGDLYIHLNTGKDPFESVVSKIDYSNDNLCRAINSGDRAQTNVSNEIMIRTESYILVDYSFKLDIIDLIWS